MNTSQSVMRSRLGLFATLASLGVGDYSTPYHKRERPKQYLLPKKVWLHKKAARLMQRKSRKINQTI